MNRYSKYFLQNALWLDDGFCEYYLQDESWGRLEILDVASVIFNWSEEALQWLNQCTAYDEFSTVRRLRVFLADHSQEHFPLHTMNDRQVLQAAARHISQNALQLVIKPKLGWAVQVDEQTAEPLQPLRTEPEPDLGGLLDQVKIELDALVIEQQKLYDKHETAMAAMSDTDKAQYYSKHAGGAVYDSAIGDTIGLVASAAKAAPGFFKGYLKTLWKVAQAPSKMAQLTVKAIAQGNMNPIKNEIDKIVDPVAKSIDQALEYKSMITILLSEPLTQDMLQNFAGQYWDATHAIERTKMGASAVTDVVVTVILAIVTVGVGAAANVAAKSARLVKVAKLLKKIAAVIKRISPDSKLLNTRKSAGKGAAPKTKKTRKAGTSTSKGVPAVEQPKTVDKTGGKGYKADSDRGRPKTTTDPKKGQKTIRKKQPQGLTQEQFDEAGKILRKDAGHLSDDIAVQGSRASHTAKQTSDIDFAVKVPPKKFDSLVKDRFGTPNPGSAKERTMQHAIKTGKIQAGEAGLRRTRKQLQKQLGMKVDLSIIKNRGAFDKAPYIQVPK